MYRYFQQANGLNMISMQIFIFFRALKSALLSETKESDSESIFIILKCVPYFQINI